MRDLLSGTDTQANAVISVIAAADPDVLLLMGIDYDLELASLSALADGLAAAGTPYPYRFALRPNTGLATGQDLDGNGRLGDARDAQGYGRFSGEGGMALLSRLPIRTAEVHDYSEFLWRDLPGAVRPEGVWQGQRLSTTGHWDVPIEVPGGQILHLLAWHATPPVFDGPEDRNGRRNHDEAAFWLRLLEGALPAPLPPEPVVILGDANLDPRAAEGRTDALQSLLAHPGLQDPVPMGAAGPATADFSALDGPGLLRVDYILPSAELAIMGAGVVWPGPEDPFLATVEAASRHRLVWVDIGFP